MKGNTLSRWKSYASTTISQGETIWAGAGAIELPCSSPLYVITAANPYGIRLPRPINRFNHYCLFLALLIAGRSMPIALTGVSRDGQWRESSWGSASVNKTTALFLAKLFLQEAIFELTPGHQRLLDARGAVRSIMPRCRP